MMLVGVAWVFALPLEKLGEGTKIDEHALQAGQVSCGRPSSPRPAGMPRLTAVLVPSLQANTYYTWDSVQIADRYLDKLTDWASDGASFTQCVRRVRPGGERQARGLTSRALPAQDRRHDQERV